MQEPAPNTIKGFDSSEDVCLPVLDLPSVDSTDMTDTSIQPQTAAESSDPVPLPLKKFRSIGKCDFKICCMQGWSC